MIKAIFFDMGNVLATWDSNLRDMNLSNISDVEVEDVQKHLWDSGLQMEYEGGAFSSYEFYEKLNEKMHFKVDYDEFSVIYPEIFTPVPGVKDILERLKGNYRLQLLSNTSELDFNKIMDTYDYRKYFDDFTKSYECCSLKPDDGIYQDALSKCGYAPEECIFIDDRLDFVEKFRSLSGKGIQFKDASQLEKELKSYGVDF